MNGVQSGDETNNWLLDVYLKTLERQIETKEDFLRQALDTIKLLKDQKLKDPRFKEIKPINDKVWKSLLKRSLIFPERSDPIGLSLANCSNLTRKETSESYLDYLNDYKSILEESNTNQKAINSNLLKLVNAFKENSDISSVSIVSPQTITNEVLKEQNNKYWEDLKHIVQKNLFHSKTQLSNEDTATVISLFQKLINLNDQTPLTVNSFQVNEYTKELYRILLSGDLINVAESKNYGSSEDREVTLINFVEDI